LDYLQVDQVVVLEQGNIVEKWGIDIAQRIRTQGFAK
jgi:Fe-S cluster assembly ATPase SufC